MVRIEKKPASLPLGPALPKDRGVAGGAQTKTEVESVPQVAPEQLEGEFEARDPRRKQLVNSP